MIVEMEWSKSKLVEFFRTHAYKQVFIEDSEHQVRIEFQIIEVLEIDLCSQTLVEVASQNELPGVELNLTLHDVFLGIHLFVSAPGEEESKISLPAEIPYSRLQLRLTDSKLQSDAN